MTPFYRAARPAAFVGIPRASIDPVLQAAGVLDRYRPALDFHTAREPLHVGLTDRGVTDPLRTPPVLVLETIAVQVDAGLNEIPRATALLAVGRDAAVLADGRDDAAAVSVVHLIEQYLDRFVPARVYAHLATTAAEGVRDLGDDAAWADEWVVLFDGLTSGPTRRSTAAEAAFALHLVHFTAALTWSSSLTAQVAAGTGFAGAFAPGAFAAVTTGVLPGYPMTALGTVAAQLAGGAALYTDFWGYRVSPQGAVPLSSGLKGFLTNLAEQDLFDWAAMARADLGASFCPDLGQVRPNSAARAALDRIEPVWKLTAPAAEQFAWGSIQAAIDQIRSARAAAGSTRAVDRADLIAAVGPMYDRAGYRYGMPIAFWLSQQNFNHPLHPGRGFAADVVGATFQELAPASFWELLAIRYANNYQIAVAPMAAGAVVIPFQPLLDRVWQTVYASEITDWDDDVQTPLPVRGVVLTSDRQGVTNVVPAGNDPSAPGAAAAHLQQDAVFDTCEPGGVFVYRAMPAWLADASRLVGAHAPGTLLGVRAMAGLPWGTVPGAVAARDRLIALDPTLGAAAAAGVAGGGVAVDNLAAPTNALRSSGYRLARALYQQERTRPRTVYARGRFRYDIGPGSLVRLELPADRYVRAALAGVRETAVTGMVLRVTLSLDREGLTASTALQVGFVRTEGEAAAGQPLYATGHPMWSCVCLGVPWSDAAWIRAKLGTRAGIETTLADLATGTP